MSKPLEGRYANPERLFCRLDIGLTKKPLEREVVMSTDPLAPGDCVIILSRYPDKKGRILSVVRDAGVIKPYHVLFEHRGGKASSRFERSELKKVPCTNDFPS
jgi:hypothetical protein